MPRPDNLEQLGNSIPSHPTTSRASAPVCSTPPTTFTPAPNIIPNPNFDPKKAFSLGPSHTPSPPMCVSRILSDKFIELTKLIPENLDELLSDTTSFAIEEQKKVKLGFL
ncbi:Hypothetical predicted protein [Paramuricea clavata]|uniref:Uncharacterized protein n=1 Tax=Paramuricea clavata TaxID=317549 RepID=A0A6S7JXL7_PARCT|nr:Hypothetical predicted protein [Paramuricea clavata]